MSNWNQCPHCMEDISKQIKTVTPSEDDALDAYEYQLELPEKEITCETCGSLVRIGFDYSVMVDVGHGEPELVHAGRVEVSSKELSEFLCQSPRSYTFPFTPKCEHCGKLQQGLRGLTGYDAIKNGYRVVLEFPLARVTCPNCNA